MQLSKTLSIVFWDLVTITMGDKIRNIITNFIVNAPISSLNSSFKPTELSKQRGPISYPLQTHIFLEPTNESCTILFSVYSSLMNKMVTVLPNMEQGFWSCDPRDRNLRNDLNTYVTEANNGIKYFFIPSPKVYYWKN